MSALEIRGMNGHADDLMVARRLASILANDQAVWFHRVPNFSRLDPPNRNLNAECGYPDNPTFADYRAAYDRIGVATRTINIWPDECFSGGLFVYETDDPEETPFEKARLALDRKVHINSYLRRIDRMSGIGRYAVLLMGFDDGRKLDQPAVAYNEDGTVRANAKKSNLLFLRCFDESQAVIAKFEDRPDNPRFGQPLFYDVNFANPRSAAFSQPKTPEPTLRQRVHWTRVIHVAENRESSEVFATPRLQYVLNDCLNIRKISASSPEMWWQAGFPGYQFVTSPEYAAEANLNQAKLAEAIEKYTSTMQRYLANKGGEWKSMAPTSSPDPTNPLMAQLTLLCAAIGVPVRVFLGTESGHLASTQDASTWKERVRGRQEDYLDPFLVRPFYDRLIDAGALPPVGDYVVAWRDLKTLGDKEQAEVGLKKTQALMQFVTGDVRQVMPLRLFLTLVLGMSDAQGRAVEKELKRNPPPPPMAERQLDQEMEVAKLGAEATVKAAKLNPEAPPGGKPQGGGRRGVPGMSPGRPAGPPRSDK